MFELTIPGIIALFTAFIQIAFAVLLCTRKKRRGSIELSWVMIALFFYSFGAGMEHISRTPFLRELSIHVQYLGMPFLPYVLFRFITAYYKLRLAHEKLYYGIYLSLGMLFMLLQFTYPYHNLFYGNRVYSIVNGFSAITMDAYPFFYLHNFFHVITAFIYIYYGLYMMIRGHSTYRRRGLLMILAVFVPVLINIIFIAGDTSIDPLPYAMLVPTAIFMYLYLNDSLFGPIPIENRYVIDSLMDGVIVLDADDVVLEFNSKAAECIPFLQERHLGKALAEVSREVPSLAFLTDGSFNESQICGHEVRIPKTDGSERYYEVRQFRIPGSKNDEDVFTVVLRDISERKRMTEELSLSYERIVEADRLKGMVIDVMSHNLRSPLQLMKSLRQLVTSKDVEQNPEIWEMGGQELDRLVDQADTLIANLLTLNILFDDEDAYPGTAVDIQAVMESVKPKAVLAASIKGLRCSCEIEEGILVHGNEKLLSLAVRNLLDNAIKYAYSGSVVSLSVLIGPSEAQVVIENEGVTIGSDVLSAIEQERWGMRKRGTTGEIGPGIGLFATRRFMHHQEGEMQISQRQNGGTRAVLRLRRLIGTFAGDSPVPGSRAGGVQ